VIEELIADSNRVKFVIHFKEDDRSPFTERETGIRQHVFLSVLSD
jgi:hypothetical protein